MSDTGDFNQHDDMWRGFVKLVTYGSAAVIAVLVLMALFLL